jgi:Protein of unknown function (DUF3326)
VKQTKPTVLFLVPTGVGARIGGFAGDALPVVRALSQVARVITHPNVCNGGSLYWPLEDVWYVEGYGLDQFCAARWALRPVYQNRIGLLMDVALDPVARTHHLNVVQGVAATLGLNIAGYGFTERPVGVKLSDTVAQTPSWGTIEDPDTLLDGAKRLIEKGAEALAVVVHFPEVVDTAYDQGQGVDPIAGVEAVISHLLVKMLGIPCAHAPSFMADAVPVQEVHPRVCGEVVGHTFLPSVLVGLSRAPQFVPVTDRRLAPTDLIAQDVDLVITPAHCCGGAGILALAGRSPAPLVLAVEENQTVLEVPPEPLGIKAVRVATYLEAIGAVAAFGAGVDPCRLRLDTPWVPEL